MSVIDRLIKNRDKKQIKVKVETSNLAISTVPMIIIPIIYTYLL
jgi:hypothetical protein